MATIKSFTSLEQSRKLAEILPLESADMDYIPIINIDGEYSVEVNEWDNEHIIDEGWIPCWSLAALFGVLPAECECMSLVNYGNNHKKYFMSYVGGGNTDIYDNPVDACVDMIERLHVLRML